MQPSIKTSLVAQDFLELIPASATVQPLGDLNYY